MTVWPTFLSEYLVRVDYERIQELLETMITSQIRQMEIDLKSVIRGFVPENLECDYDLIQNNPYFLMKETFCQDTKFLSQSCELNQICIII